MSTKPIYKYFEGNFKPIKKQEVTKEVFNAPENKNKTKVIDQVIGYSPKYYIVIEETNGR